MFSTPEKWKGRPTNSVPFGLKDGKLHYVTEVSLGKDCGCKCPECDMPLVAKNNPAPDRKRAFHFQHYSTTNCSGGWESARHRMAKEIVLRASTLTLPSWSCGETVAPESIFTVAGDSAAEIRILDGQMRPDIRVSGESSSVAFSELYVEIRVHHAVDTEKATIVKNSGISMIEIDLSNVSDEQLLDEEYFAKIVLQEASNRKWIHLSNATYLSTVAKTVVVEIISPVLRIKTVPKKAGGTFDVIQQDGIIHQPGNTFSFSFEIPDQYAGVEPAPYKPGLYSISGKSWVIDRYQQLRIGYKLYLDLIEMDLPKGLGPEQQSLNF